MTLGSIVAGRSCGSTTVATIMSQRSLKTTDIAALHPGNRDWPASAEGRNLADKIEVAHAIEVGVICDTGRAIAGAELGTQIELNLGAAIGRLTGKMRDRFPTDRSRMATSPPPRPGGRDRDDIA